MAGHRSFSFFFFWQAVCDQLSPHPLFLCSFPFFPSVASRNSLPAQFVEILLGYNQCRGTIKRFSLDTSFIPVRYLPLNSSIKVPEWGKSVQKGPGSQHRWVGFLIPACPFLRWSFGLVSSGYRGAVTIFPLGGGAPWGGAAVGGGTAAG